MEIWKDIDNYENHYQVSNFGRVRSLKEKPYIYEDENKIIKPRYNGNKGYAKVALYKYNKRKQHFIHKLVAIAFIPRIKGKPYVNHKNGIKTDNRVENLEWCTNRENINHAKGSKHGMSKLTEQQVLNIRKEYNNGSKVTELAKKYRVSYCTIYGIVVTKKLWKHLLEGSEYYV